MNRSIWLVLRAFCLIVLLIGLFVLPDQVIAAQNPLNSKCSVTFNNSRAASGNNFFYQTDDTAFGDYLGNNGHVRLWMADINGQALNALPPSVTQTNSYQGINQYRITECTADNTTCGGNLPFSLADMPGGKYLAYCDVNINSGPIAGVQCSGNPFCTWGAASDSYTSVKYSPSNFCTTPPGPDTQYCQPVYAGQSPTKVVSVVPYISNVVRSCAGPNNPAFTISTSAIGNFQQMRILSNNFNVTPGGYNGTGYSESGYTNGTVYQFEIEGLARDGSWVSSSSTGGGYSMQALNCTPPANPTITTLANACAGPNQPNLAFFWSSTGAQRYYMQVWSSQRGLIYDGYYAYNNYSPPNQTNNEGFYLRIWGTKNLEGNEIWSAYSDYGMVYNQNCTPSTTPIVSVSSNVCTDANKPQLSFVWSASGAATYYAQAFSTSRGLILDGYTNATSYTPPGQVNGEGFSMRVYAISATGGWSTYGETAWSYAQNCAQPGIPTVTMTPVCGGPSGTQSQLNYSWVRGSLTEQLWTYDETNSWVSTANASRSYTVDTIPGATYQIAAADRRYVTGPGGATYAIQSYQNGSYFTFVMPSGAAISSNGTFATQTTPAAPNCAPPGGFNYSYTTSTNAQCAVSGTPTVTLNWSASAGATSYIITRNGPGGIRTFVTTGLSYLDATVTKSQTYTYSMVASRTLFDGRVVSTAGTPPSLSVTTASCDVTPPQILGVSTPGGGCYDRFNWPANNVVRVRAQDLPAGTGAGIGNVTVRFVKTTAPSLTTDYTASIESANDNVYATSPISLSFGNRYDEYQIWAKADDRVVPANSTNWVQMFPVNNTPYYFYTQPSCAAPFLQTNQGSVHSNDQITVPTPGPGVATPSPSPRSGGPQP